MLLYSTFCVDARNPNPSLHTLVASTLLTKPSSFGPMMVNLDLIGLKTTWKYGISLDEPGRHFQTRLDQKVLGLMNGFIC